MAENTDTASSIKVADIVISDDGLGTNTLVLGGSDAGLFEIVGGNELHLKAGVSLDFESQSLLNVSVAVDDSAIGGFPDDLASLAVMLSDLNECPVASDDICIVDTNSLIVGAPGILANDTDSEGDSLNIVLVTPPSHGLITLGADGSFTYIPQAGFVGTDFFIYQVDNGVNAPSLATVQLIVNVPAAAPAQTFAGAPQSNDNESVPSTLQGLREPLIIEIVDDDVDGDVDDEIEESNRVETSVERPSSGDATPAIHEIANAQTNVEANSLIAGHSEETWLSYFFPASYSTGDMSTAEAATAETRTAAYPLANALLESLDELRHEVSDEDEVNKAIIGSMLAASTSLSVGYVIWLIRGGVLLSSVLSSLPAWRTVDPLPVLGYVDDEDGDSHDESLESLVAESNLAPAEIPAEMVQA